MRLGKLVAALIGRGQQSKANLLAKPARPLKTFANRKAWANLLLRTSNTAKMGSDLTIGLIPTLRQK